MPTTVPVYTLVGSVEDIRDRDGQDFDRDTYSRMKHGDTAAITALGTKLGQMLIQQVPTLVTDPTEVVLPVAFMTVPPSCYYLSVVVADLINQHRLRLGHAPARIIRIAKDSVTQTDYAASSMAEREAEMQRIDFALDEPITGLHVVLVDDVRVTGLAERTALEAMAHETPSSMTVAYVAVVEGTLQGSPHVEAALNHATVTSIMDMLPAIQRGDFALTIRFLKRCLKSDPETLGAFLRECPLMLLNHMHDGALSSGSEFVKANRESIALIEKEVGARVCSSLTDPTIP